MKYIELFKNGFDSTIDEKIKPENGPYVGYSPNEGFAFTVIPEPYVTFIAEEDGSSVGLTTLNTNQTLEYSTDTTTWNTFDTTTNISLNNGDKAYVRGVLSGNTTGSNYTQFKMSGKIAASGNCNAIWNYEDLEAPLKAYCGYCMFSDCASLTTAPELPAVTLSEWCYSWMFQSCTSLTVAPELPAETLVDSCYRGMFNNCTSLVTAPELPATKLVDNCYCCMFFNCTSLVTAPLLPATMLAAECYSSMFYGCKSLNSTPELPATTLTWGCYNDMFSNCTSLTDVSELPAITLADYCYKGMFSGCKSLTTAPVLPADKLVFNCYDSMFLNCNKLNYIKCLATNISYNRCTYNWVKGVSSTGTFMKHPDMNKWTTGVNGIPSGWDVGDGYIPQECVKLEITADNVSGRKTNTTIYYTAITNGVDYKGDTVEKIITGTVTSNEFGQNTSYTDTVERTITFEFMGVTATTTITQGVWIDNSYEVVLNEQWRLSETQSNPDSTLYDGVYESFSNKGVNNSTATMYIDLVGYTEFDVYIRSYAESNYDYVTISESNSTVEKASTKGKQNSGQTISSYTKVHYDNLTGEDRITITYRKDSSDASGNDQGYILIPKQ